MKSKANLKVNTFMFFLWCSKQWTYLLKCTNLSQANSPLTKSGLKNLLIHKVSESSFVRVQNNSTVALLWWCSAQAHKEEEPFHRGGSVSHRRAQSDCLQNRLPITQHFGRVRTHLNSPVRAVFNRCSSYSVSLLFSFFRWSLHGWAALCYCMSVTSSSAWSQTQSCWRQAGWGRHCRSLESVSENRPNM